MGILETRQRLPDIVKELRKRCQHTRVFEISCATRHGTDELMRRVFKWYSSIVEQDPSTIRHEQDETLVLNSRMLARYGDALPAVVPKTATALDDDKPVRGQRLKKGAYEPRVEWDVLEEAWRIKHP